MGIIIVIKSRMNIKLPQTLKTLRLCVFAVMISISALHSQTVEVIKSTKIEKTDGKEYYIHNVIKGQTLYSISKAYNVLISEIIFENPEAIDGIKPDMVLRIPVAATATAKDGAPQEQPLEINGKYRIHIVEKGQTMYAVSRLYNLSVYELMLANPGIDETLSLGQKLNIPIVPLIKPGETVNTSDAYNTDFFADTGNINMLLLLPLYTDNNKKKSYDTSGTSANETIYQKSLNGLEFYEGALLAADSLSKAGIRATIYTLDIPDDHSLDAVYNNPVFKKADIIVGPFYGTKFEAVAAFAKENKIACVTPVLRKNELVANNPFVSKVIPSDETQITQMGDFIGRWDCNKNIIILHNASAEDSVLLENLLSGIHKRCDSAKVHILNTKGRSVKLVDSVIVAGIENIVVSFSEDQSYVSRLILNLEKKNDPKKMRTVTLFGLPEWQDFENIEIEYFQDVNLHIPVDHFVDYNRPEVKSFLLKFREKYLAEPGKYGFSGYDVTMYYLQMLKKYGNDFFANPPAIHSTGLQNNFDFKKVSQEGGLENQCTFILNYNDYRLVKVN